MHHGHWIPLLCLPHCVVVPLLPLPHCVVVGGGSEEMCPPHSSLQEILCLQQHCSVAYLSSYSERSVLKRLHMLYEGYGYM